MLRQTLPKSVVIETAVARDLWPVLGDATQLYQVLLNLCVNARDAMPHGGLLTLHAANRPLDAAGPHVLVSVADTGGGMSAAVLEKIFDPFFTTKETGTGLGLSTALGIVKSHRGFITVHSDVGRGSRFMVYLPSAEAVAAEPAPAAAALPAGSGEEILVVDDEAPVRRIAQAVLEAYGYRVLTARSGEEALATLAGRRREVRAVVTDIMMPGMGGVAAIQALRGLAPGVRVLAMTGLSLSGPQEVGADAVLPKPFTAASLLTALRKLLGEGGAE